MKTLIELLKSSVLTQAMITIITLCVISYLILAGRPVPPELWALGSLVVGFYFGSKVGIVQGETRSRIL